MASIDSPECEHHHAIMNPEPCPQCEEGNPMGYRLPTQHVTGYTPLTDAMDRFVQLGMDVFGRANMKNPDIRMERFLEEVFELAQAHGVSKEDAAKVLDYAYTKEPGDVKEEAADALFTLSAFINSLHIDIVHHVNLKIDKVMSKHAHFREKGEQKKPILT